MHICERSYLSRNTGFQVRISFLSVKLNEWQLSMTKWDINKANVDELNLFQNPDPSSSLTYTVCLTWFCLMMFNNCANSIISFLSILCLYRLLLLQYVIRSIFLILIFLSTYVLTVSCRVLQEGDIVNVDVSVYYKVSRVVSSWECFLIPQWRQCSVFWFRSN